MPIAKVEAATAIKVIASLYSGCGNDFLLIDNRKDELPQFSPRLIKELCEPKNGPAADGLILVGSSQSADISMKFFNCDGNEAEMCGNGVRCLMQFLRQRLSYPRTRCLLETQKRELLIRCEDDDIVVHMGRIQELEWNIALIHEKSSFVLHHIDSGVPHLVTFVSDIEAIDVMKVGSFFRHHPHVAPRGANVNFVCITSPHTVSIRTFERGVERETLSCGTGVCATAYVLQKLHGFASPISFHVRSNEWMQVSFELQEGVIDNLALKGPAKWIRDVAFSIDFTAQQATLSSK